MTVVIHEKMTPEEQAIAEHFERGLSDADLSQATLRFGTATSELLSPRLSQLLHERALKDGESQLEIMRKAIEAYLMPA